MRHYQYLRHLRHLRITPFLHNIARKPSRGFRSPQPDRPGPLAPGKKPLAQLGRSVFLFRS